MIFIATGRWLAKYGTRINYENQISFLGGRIPALPPIAKRSERGVYAASTSASRPAH
jgi:hypothetical protein